MSEREAAQKALAARNKSANPSAFDVMGAFSSYYNPTADPNKADSVPLGFGVSMKPTNRAEAIASFNAQQKAKAMSAGSMQPAAQQSGFWSKVFAGMEKAYNFSSQIVSFGLTLGEEDNPLFQGGFDFNNVKKTWDAARQISPGRAFVRTFAGNTIDDIEGLFSGVVKTVSGGKLSGADKFLQDHMLFAANDFSIFDEAQREKAFREQNIGRFSSLTTDTIARFTIDPTIFAAKLYTGYKAAGIAVKSAEELKGIMAGTVTGRRATRVRATMNDFLEKTDGMNQSDLFRVKAIRESANPATFADVLADANKIDDKFTRHQAKMDIIHWAMGDAAAANRLVETQSAIAAKIGQLQDEVVNAKYFGAGYNQKTGQFTFDLTNNGPDYENVVELAKQYEGELATISKKLATEAIIDPTKALKFDTLSLARTAAARSQEFIDVRAGAAGGVFRVLTGFAYKTPKGWIDFTDNQSVQTLDNMLNRVRGFSDKQRQVYVTKIAEAQNKLKAGVADPETKKELIEQVKSLKADMKQAAFTVQRRDELFAKYTQAIDPNDRSVAYQQIEEELFNTVARQFGFQETDVRKAWATFSSGRAKAHNIIRERAYTGAIDPATGAPVGAKVQPIVGDEATYVIPLPLNETQLVKQLPTLDIDQMYNVLTRYTRANRLDKGGKVYNKLSPIKDAGEEFLDGLDSLLKFEVLARVGYPVRNVTEGHMRILTTAGPMVILNKIKTGSRNIISNGFKGASLDDIYNWSDSVKLNTKRTELVSMLDNTDDPIQIQREIDEIDKMLDGTIKIKDRYGLGLREVDGIKYEDALGATPERARYIEEKFISNAAKIVDNHFSESSKKLKNLYETNGDFVVIKGSDAMWEDAYYRVINRQVRNSKLTSIMLQAKPREQLIDEAEMFLLKDPEGRKILKNLAMGRDARAIAEANMLNVESLFPSWVNPKLKAIASKRAVTLEDIKKYFGTDTTRRPDVNAAQIGAANGTGVASRMWGDFLEGFYKVMGEIPESELVRNPLFIDLYRKRMAASVQNAIETYPGKDIPQAYLRKLENSSRQWARAELRRTLYDTSERVSSAKSLKYVFPFFGAFADVAEKWGRIVLNDPSVIRKLQTVYDSPDRSGMVEERDGITYINLPGEWTKRLTLGKVDGRPLAIPKPSLNLIFQGGAWWNPGAGWFVQFPASAIVKAIPDLERNALVKEILPYGADGTGWKDLVVQSAGARKIMAIFDENDPMRRNLTVLIAAEENQKYDAGLRATSPTAKEINNRVKGILSMEAAARLVLPFATSTRSPYQYYIDEYHRLREENPITAADKFYDTYGEDFYLFTTSLSKNNTGIGATIEADKRSKELSDLIAKNPEFGWFLVGDANAGQFSPTVYQKQRELAVAPGSTTKFRESQDPYEAIKETNAEKGWIEYNKINDLIEAQRIARGLKSLNSKGAEDLKQIKQEFVDDLSTENPDWASVRGKIDTNKVNNFLKFANTAIKDPRLANRSDMKSVKEYLEVRELVVNSLAQRKSKSLDNEGNADIKAIWDEFIGDLIDQDVTFNKIYTRILENDDLRKGL